MKKTEPINEPKFKKIMDDEWVQPKMSGYLMRCCDCGLVHKLTFKILQDDKGHYLKFKARRITSQERRQKAVFPKDNPQYH